MISQGKRRLIVRLRGRRRAREGAFLVEGVRGAEEALAAGVRLRFCVVSDALNASERGRALLRRLRAGGHEAVEVEEEVMAELADTEAPQGVLIVCEEAGRELEELPGTSEATGGALRLLCFDGLQDPGNAGTLIRAASAFAVDAIVALDGTVDLWNPKVVRASAGASFRIPVVRAKWIAYHEWLRERGIPLYVADAEGEDVRLLDLPPGEGWSLVVGNEGKGPGPEVLESATGKLSVPMPGGVESLNAGVAGAILMYELTGRERSA